MEEIFAETHASSTDTTIVAMIDRFALTVLPELADVTVVVGGNFATTDACVRCFLRSSTNHAKHIPGFPANKIMVLIRIMAEAACVPLLAGKALKFDVSLIVLTPEGLVRFWYHLGGHHRCFTPVMLRLLYRNVRGLDVLVA